MKLIVDANNREYYELRAAEMMREADDALGVDNNTKTYHDKISMAISLLVLARAKVMERE